MNTDLIWLVLLAAAIALLVMSSVHVAGWFLDLLKLTIAVAIVCFRRIGQHMRFGRTK